MQSFTGTVAFITGAGSGIGLTDALRHEVLASNVHVMCVHPGVVKTNLGANAPARSEAERRANIKRQNITLTTAPRAARLILRGIERRKPRLVIGADGRLMDLLGRYAPARYPQMTYPVLRRVEPLIGAAVDGLAGVPGGE